MESVVKVKKSGIFPLRFLFQFVLKKNNNKLEARATFLCSSSYLGLRNATMDVTQTAVLGSVSCLSVISPSSKWLEASLTVHLESGGLQYSATGQREPGEFGILDSLYLWVLIVDVLSLTGCPCENWTSAFLIN